MRPASLRALPNARAWGVLGALVSCLVLSGCGSAGGNDAAQAETPDGFARASTKLVSFAYPEQWKKLPDDAYPQGWPVAFGKNSQQGGVAQVAVYTNLPKTTDADMALEAAIASFELSRDFTRQEERAVKVPAAESAWRLDYTYVADGQEQRKVQGTDVAVTNKQGQAALVRITRYEGTLDKSVVSKITKSIVVKRSG